MLAVTSDKALLRAVWELVGQNGKKTVGLSEAAEHLRTHGNGAADVDALEVDARLLQELGFLRLVRVNGTRDLELTQVGAFLATRLTL